MLEDKRSLRLTLPLHVYKLLSGVVGVPFCWVLPQILDGVVVGVYVIVQAFVVLRPLFVVKKYGMYDSVDLLANSD